MSVPQALEVAADFAVKVGKLRNEDFGGMGPRVQPHFASGKLRVSHNYQAAYQLINEVYLVVVQHWQDNPFHSDYILESAKTMLSTMCKGDITLVQLQKRYAELVLAFEKLLEGKGSEPEPSDWEQLSKGHWEQLRRMENLTSVEFTIPETSLLTAPQESLQFGEAFAFKKEALTPTLATEGKKKKKKAAAAGGNPPHKKKTKAKKDKTKDYVE